jgi:hypothetical protein
MAERLPVNLVTGSDIAKRLGQPVSRVRWILATRHHIRASARAGAVRVYSTAVIAQVQDEIDHIDSRRGRKEVARD